MASCMHHMMCVDRIWWKISTKKKLKDSYLVMASRLTYASYDASLNYEDIATAVKKINKPLIVERTPTQFEKIQKDQLKRGTDKSTQIWLKNHTKCPKETVPIKQTTVVDITRANFLSESKRKGQFFYDQLDSTTYYKIYVAEARINVWKPSIDRDTIGYSTARIRIISRSPVDFDAIEVGWHVYPWLYDKDQDTKFFISWTNSSCRKTCYYRSEQCDGFMLYGGGIAPGTTFDEVSSYGGEQYDMLASIWMDIGGLKLMA
ncbi:uncharacterized protein LOC119981850 [Tripterygium wilfordii]|uniref:uncharacterized protein LOC119981850 n=1 Tax=Tripterygium wilfordii TaxID=458696 RepID=UPI0018F7E6D0|nr:uncharacterized protein LOC119981850 [Tripterygium wilfordii]